uniref:Protein glass n=2 Tax=Lygus hesperus TaxID=30085 RepID=A0A0A9XIN3_LYGHE
MVFRFSTLLVCFVSFSVHYNVVFPSITFKYQFLKRLYFFFSSAQFTMGNDLTQLSNYFITNHYCLFQLLSSDEIVNVFPVPRLKIKAATGSAANSVVSSPVRRNSSPVDTERDSRRSPTPLDPEIEEEVDVESVCQTETGEKRRKPENPMKKSKRSMSSSSEEEVVRKHPRRGRPWARERSSRSVQNSSPTNAPPTTRALRARKPINLKEIDADSDSEPIPELANLSGGESDVDPDFDPSTEFKRGRKRGRKMSTSSESCSENETRSSKVSTGCSSNSSVAGSVSCSQCKASYANISGLRAHHRLSEKCGKFPPGTIFRCSDCSKMFISQSMLDAHHSENLCQKSLRTPTPTNSNPSKASSTTSERRPHNLATGPHVCKCCKVVFNSALGMGLHLKRSQKCIADNPEVDLPGVVNRLHLRITLLVPPKRSPQTKQIKNQPGYGVYLRQMLFVVFFCLGIEDS